jgi:WD40 repeat protein
MTEQNSMPRLRPVIRVFVSSTFSDLKAERNALQEQVFLRLEQLCAQNGFQFQAIDLRWGVSSEAGLDHRTMRICFDELRRAQDISPRPNFLILLGNRYGWRPLPEEISVAEFQALESVAAQVATNTDQPAGAVLQAWYRQDENAVPPVYLLQSRRQQLPDAKDYTQVTPWNEVQVTLWEIINRAQPPEQLRGRFDAAALAEGSPPAIVRFQASATEQEIWHGALRVSDAHEHVLAFLRHIENIGEFSESAQVRDFVDLGPSGRVDIALQTEQERLKEVLRTRLGEKNVVARSVRLVSVRDAQGQPIADITTNHLTQFCSDVEKRLKEIIQGQFEKYWHKTAQASTERAARELKIEQDEHERFGRERGGADSFVGRQTELQAIRDYLQNESCWPLVVHGASGCGKTALLARAAEEQQKSEVIVRFIGTTPYSSDVRSLLRNLCQKLRERNRREGELPTDVEALREELQEHFKSATPEQPLFLFLDALDQLSDADNGRLLNWITASQLPVHVKLVVACLSDRTKDDPAGQPFAELTRRKLTANNIINLNALTEDEARMLLFDRWLPHAGRTVSREQRERIRQRLKSEECRQPIYLKLLFEEARFWRSYDEPPELGASVPAILRQLIERLGRPANHGVLLVERVLGYLAASRHGLAENEIVEVLFADPEYKVALDQATEQTRHELPAGARRIPIAIWSRLRFDLAPYLTERASHGANVLTFYHRQVGEWVQEHFEKTTEHCWQAHRRLADYFTACAKGTAVEWETDSIRGFAECVYQLIKAEQHEHATRLLSNFPFFLHKLRVGLIESVFADYDLFRREAPTRVMKRLEIWADFFREKAHILRRGNEEWPPYKIFLQIAVEHADDSPITVGAEQWLTKGRCNWLWLRHNQREARVPENLRSATLEGHSRPINGALTLSDNCIASWSLDNTLRLWDMGAGICRATCQGHTDTVNGALALVGGRLLSWSDDTTLRLWDPRSGACVGVFRGHTNSVAAALELTNGWLLSWGGYPVVSRGELAPDCDLRFWDKAEGRCVATLKGHKGSITGAMELTHRRLVSWSRDGTLRLWNLDKLECLAILEGHTSDVDEVLILSDGRLLSKSYDKTLRVWDAKSFHCLATLSGHTYAIEGVSALANGKLLSWSRDKTLRIWDSHSGACLAILEGHKDFVWGALELEGRRIISWSRDGTVRVWDQRLGKCLKTLADKRPIWGVVALDDRRVVSWSRDESRLTLWDTQSGQTLARLEGHTSAIEGALRLGNSELLSWSRDGILRLWHCPTTAHSECEIGIIRFVGYLFTTIHVSLRLWWKARALRSRNKRTQTLATLLSKQGGPPHYRYESDHTRALSDGRLLYWSDNSIELWDCQGGSRLATFVGHGGPIQTVIELNLGRLLSWSRRDNTLRVWDIKSQACLEVLSEHDFATRHPELALAFAVGTNPASVHGRFYLRCEDSSHRTVRLNHASTSASATVSQWDCDCDAVAFGLLRNGTVAVLAVGTSEVCFLRLYRGLHRVSLADVDKFLASPNRLQKH